MNERMDEFTLRYVSTTPPPTHVCCLAWMFQGGSQGEGEKNVAGFWHLTFHRSESSFSTMESAPRNPQPTQSDPLETFPQRKLEAGDIAVLVLYFFFVLAVGLWVSQARGRQKGEETSSRSYNNRNFKNFLMHQSQILSGIRHFYLCYLL